MKRLSWVVICVIEMNSTVASNYSYPNLTIETLSAVKLQRLIPSIVYVTILLVVGTPGNTVVVYVYYKRWRKSSTRIFILSLAILDLINCVFSLPMELANMFLYLKFDYGWICKLSRFLTYFCNSTGALVLIAIAVDRYQRICKPHGNHMTTKTAKIICFVAFMLSSLTTWPALIIYGTQHIPLSRTLTLKMCLIENAFVHTPYPLAYFLFMCIATFINFITLTVLYSFVGARVCRRKKMFTIPVRSTESCVPDEYEEDRVFSNMLDKNNRQHSLQNSKDESLQNSRHSLQNGNGSDKSRQSPGTFKLVLMNAANTVRKTKDSMTDRHMRRIGKTTFMLFVVTLVYVLSFIPFLGIVIHRSIFPKHFSNLSPSGETAFQLFLRSYLLNCAVNPVIYSFCNDLFRKECCKLFLNVICVQKRRR